MPISDDYDGGATFESFSELISAPSQKAIAQVLRYSTMTKVQVASLPVCAAGHDVLAKARTGTGKTLGYLVPAVEAMLRKPKVRPGEKVSVVVICPTRELALQVAREGGKLLAHHPFKIRSVIGGVQYRQQKTKLLADRPDVIIATPGRFLDHARRTKGFADALKGVRVLVLDECDKLLEMGFFAEIKAIVEFLPKCSTEKRRQTFLYSATVPKAIRHVAMLAMRPGYKFIDVVCDDGLAQNQQTVAGVSEEYVVCALEQPVAVLYSIICAAIHRAEAKAEAEAAAEPKSAQRATGAEKGIDAAAAAAAGAKFKVIVFCMTARIAGFLSSLFRRMAREQSDRGDQTTGRLPPLPRSLTADKILEIHSKKKQHHRSATSERFRRWVHAPRARSA
jgi:superfamily II DNA/RNA helicase